VSNPRTLKWLAVEVVALATVSLTAAAGAFFALWLLLLGQPVRGTSFHNPLTRHLNLGRKGL
jgi:hypothetical protein